jgi:acyl-coenzyme A thioesterase PaaI-like protein
VAIGKVVKAGRKQVFASGELFGVRDGQRKLVATATTLLVPGV